MHTLYLHEMVKFNQLNWSYISSNKLQYAVYHKKV